MVLTGDDEHDCDMIDSNSNAIGAEHDLPATDDASLDRLRRFGGGKLLGQMMDIFLESTPQRLAVARAGIAAGDIPSVERAFHSLKSSAAQLGAFRMQRLCERGEHQAHAGSLTNAPAILDALDAELPRVIEWLEKARIMEAP